MAEATNFNINSKKSVKNFKTNSDNVLSICILNDGRIATSTFGEIVIYNLEKNQRDMEINENIEEVSHLFEMSSGYLFSSACEECIIYEIKENTYEIIQKLGGIDGDTSKSYELNNGDIITLSRGIYIFSKDPALNQYSLSKTIEEDEFLNDVIQVNDDKIIISSSADKNLKVWNINDWSEYKTINDVSVASYHDCLYKKDEFNLIVGGNKEIYLIDLKEFIVKKKFKNDYEVFNICPISESIFLTLGNEGIITQWKYNDNDIKKEHEKDKISDEECLCMKYIKDGRILIGSSKNVIILE